MARLASPRARVQCGTFQILAAGGVPTQPMHTCALKMLVHVICKEGIPDGLALSYLKKLADLSLHLQSLQSTSLP